MNLVDLAFARQEDTRMAQLFYDTARGIQVFYA